MPWGTKQQLSLGSGCFTDNVIIHEFIHAIGFHHEQNRPDRNQYVKVHKNRLVSWMAYNYDIQSDSLTFGVPYDGKSIMHYRSFFFQKGTEPAMESRVSHHKTAGGKSFLELWVTTFHPD